MVTAGPGPGAPGPTHVPVVMLGPDDPAVKVRGLRAGADDYQVAAGASRRARGPGPPAAGPVPAAGRRSPARATPRPQPVTRQPAADAWARSSRSTAPRAAWAPRPWPSTPPSRSTASCSAAVVLVDANLQFGDHRVFLDLGNDRHSIVDAVTAPAIDADLLSTVVVHHDSGIDLLAGADAPEEAEHVSAERHHMATDHGDAAPDVRLRGRRPGQAARRPQPGHHLGRRPAAGGHDRRPVVHQERAPRAGDDEPDRRARRRGRAGAQPQQRLHGHQRQVHRGGPQAHHPVPGRQRLPDGHQRPQQRRAVPAGPPDSRRSAARSWSSCGPSTADPRNAARAPAPSSCSPPTD